MLVHALGQQIFLFGVVLKGSKCDDDHLSTTLHYLISTILKNIMRKIDDDNDRPELNIAAKFFMVL